MIANVLDRRPGLISVIALVVGFLLVMTGQLSLSGVGIALFVLAFLVPFLRLSSARARQSKSTQGPAPSVRTLETSPSSSRIPPALGQDRVGREGGEQG